MLNADRWKLGLYRLSRLSVDWAAPRSDADLFNWADTQLSQTEYCRRCGRTTGANEATPQGCSACLHLRLPWTQLTRLTAYLDPVPAWIKAMKYHGQWPLAESLGRLLAQRLGVQHQDAPPRWLITQVPMHPLRRWARGYDQAELLAKTVADTLPGHRRSVHLPLLRRTRLTRKQSRVALDRRAANVKDAFKAHPVELKGRRVLLIDDVKTTGATLKACARVLRKAGAADIQVAVIAVA